MGSESHRRRGSPQKASWRPLGALLEPLGAEKSNIGMRPRAIPTLFFRLQEPPRARQEASKRLSEGFRVEDTIRIPFWSYFWLEKESPRHEKSRKSFGVSTFFKVSPFLAGAAFGPRFWTLLASLLGAFCPPRWLKPLLEFLLERPRADQGNFFRARAAPRALQEPKQRVPKEGPKKDPTPIPR